MSYPKHLISPRQAKRFGLERAEESRTTGAVRTDHINDRQYQGGSAVHGRRVSKGGGIGGAESQERTGEIDRGPNKRKFPAGVPFPQDKDNSHWINRYRKEPASTRMQSYGPNSYQGDRATDASHDKEIFNSVMKGY